MTVAGSTVGQRYHLHDVDGREGAAERWIGTDERLNRPVIVWVLERDETHVARDQLLSIARGVARQPEPAFLQVLDIVPDASRLAIVLEMPEPPDDGDGAIRLSATAAARMMLDLAESLEAAEAAGLPIARLSPEYLHRGDGGAVRADAIGLLLPSRRSGAPSAAPLVDLLAAVLEPRSAVRDTPREQAAHQQLRELIERWELQDGTLAVLADELRAVPGVASRSGVTAPRVPPEPAEAIEATTALTYWPPARPSAPAPPRPQRREGRVRWSVAVPAAAAALAILLGLVGLVVATQIGLSPAGLNPSGGDSAGPPVEQPAANEVTVGLRAQEPTNVRVTVDGVVQFDGVLNAGERQLWEGTDGIRVWTDRGQTLLLSVNGHDLGPYSPAMGARENNAEIAGWNRIDFGFWPGWAP